MSASSTFLATDGEGYELNMGRFSRQLAPQFLAFAGSAPGERVLDIGCGTGHLAGAVAQLGDPAGVLGIDLAAPYVEYARRQYPDRRIEFRVGDACALDLPSQAFDRVLAMLVLHFVPRASDAIAEMRRVARPGATLAACVWDARGGQVANRLFFDTAAALDPEAARRRARNYTRPMTRPGELAAAWHAAGLQQVQETVLMIRMVFASFEDYWAPYRGNDGPGAEYVRSLDESARSRLMEAVRAAYLDGEEDGPRSYAALAWAVKGVAPD